MKYMLLIYADEYCQDEAARQACYTESMQLVERLKALKAPARK